MEVISSNFKNHPSCPHGPCLLFERYSSNGAKTGRKFFACSACRDRSDCNYFQWADEELSEARKKMWDQIKKEKRTPLTHEEYMKQLELFKSIPAAEQRKYCKTCSLLLLDKFCNHSKHDIVKNLNLKDLLQPSLLFSKRENKKVEAQYFFSHSTVSFIVSLLKSLGFTKLISIGVPKIHEYLASNQINGISSFFMDIDYRYMQFFSPEQFCHYNMFNNHFFGGKESKRIFKNYLAEGENDKIVIILDPPFGGLIDAISYSLKKINKWWQSKNNKPDENVPVIWIFPYFHEGRIVKNLPDMKMMDYKVEYENHKKFKKDSSKSSPVRIFTNISAADFVLPVEQGYRLCDICQRFVSLQNQHCLKCNACTTKHGKTYRHCDECQQCVKPSYVHCQICNKCGLSSADVSVCKGCKSNSLKEGDVDVEKCFACKGIGHRKRNCPESRMKSQVKRKKFNRKIH